MSSGRRPPSKQLDMPLVWELEPIPEGAGGDEGPFQAPPSPAPAAPGAGRLILAALADLGLLLLAVALAWGIAVGLGAPIDPVRFLLAALVGGETWGVVAVACLWAWRGTPGMLLLGAGLAAPLRLGRAAGASLWWLVCLPLAGIPLVVGPSGRRGLERLARVRLSRRSAPSSA